MGDGSPGLSDQHYDWTSRFLGFDVRGTGGPSAAGAAPATVPGSTPGGSAAAGAPVSVPAGASGNAQPGVMDEAWIVSFLTRHRFGPPGDPNAPADACMFDRAASTVTAVVKALDADAQQYGVGLNADRANIVDDVLQQHKRGAIMGGSLAKHMQAGDDVALFLAGLQKQKMVSMLEALQTVRGAHQLDEVLDMTRNNLHDQRLEVAILSVQQHLGGEWQQLYDKLTDDADKTAIRTHVFQRIDDGDTGDKKLIKHGDKGYENETADDAAWIAGFLKFVNASPDPSGDGSGTTCQFDGIPMPFQRAVDTVVEQAAKAGRMINDSAVSGPLARLVVAPPKRRAGGTDAPQYSVAYALQPQVPQAGGTPSPAQSQTSFTGTIALHPDGAAGPEIAWTVQIASSVKGYVLQSIVTGPQAQWVWPFLNGCLQLQVMASALAGGANTGNEVRGSVPLVPSVQLSAGGQVTYAIPGTGKHVLIGFQLAGQLTGTAGQGPTAALVPQGFVQVQW